MERINNTDRSKEIECYKCYRSSLSWNLFWKVGESIICDRCIQEIVKEALAHDTF